jgi:hypothetical protein
MVAPTTCKCKTKDEIMAVTVQWDDDAEKKAIIWTLVGRWTWDEFGQAFNDMQAMVESAPGPVDFIYDVRRMAMLPADVITRLKLDYLKIPAKAGRLMAVGVDEHLQFFWNTFTDLPYASHLKMRYFDTLEEARAFVRTSRS